MKNMIKVTALAAALVTLGACSSTVTIAERDSYAQPKWYASCAQAGTEGFFWWKKNFVYACGAGQSKYQQAAEEQMYAIAMNNFAKRINGKVNSETKISFKNDVRNTSTEISYKVTDTAVTQHLEEERGTYIYAGDHYTFVKLRMPKEVFDSLLTRTQ
jgi:hypothetical protein|tara:strand:- start:349 stop:822 length:474 start_codon:yes stop_codon:yes gene_type:complete